MRPRPSHAAAEGDRDPAPRPAPQGPRPGSATATAAGLAAVSMWGLAPVATRALVLQLPPLPLLVIRMAVASVVLLPWCRPLLRRPVPPHPAGHRSGRRLLTRLVMAGLLGMVGYNLPVTVGLQWVPASTAGLVLASEPAWLLVLAAVFLGERASRRSWAGVAVAQAYGASAQYFAMWVVANRLDPFGE